LHPRLDPHLFSHEAHLRLGWIHLKKYGATKACENVCEQILKFDITHDKGEKFHKTLTVASVKIIHHFIQESEGQTFQEFIQEFPRLKTDFKSLMDKYYGFAVYQSEEARLNYLEPDLLAFG